MTDDPETIEFSDDLESLRERRDELEQEVQRLESKLQKTSTNTKSLRENLRQLRKSVETGRVPVDEEGERSDVARIDRVEVNPETHKPKRGARARQIRQAIEVVSERKEEFKAAELFDLIQKADPNVSESQRAYLYSKLNDLRDEGKLEKVKRGTWTLAD